VSARQACLCWISEFHATNGRLCWKSEYHATNGRRP
jgi:hypothetical protein